MKSGLRLASVSDIHLGHSKTPTLHIVTNLGRAFPDAASTHELDMILVGGDLFDRLLSLNQIDVSQILEWAGHFIPMCERHQIHLVFMEGTPTHDWGQTRLLEILNKLGMGGKYFHYITELSIERFEDLGIDVLFVPDEWRPEPDDTWKEVCHLLKVKSLEQVDFTVLHGAFEFQLPAHVKAPRHSSERYESITRHRVLGAHIHTPCSRGKIRVNGSFDRLEHGQEEAKGHWRFLAKSDGTLQDTFVVNRHAMTYLTVDCTGLPVDDALKVLESKVSQLDDGSHVRVKADKTDPILQSFDVLRKRFPLIHWTSKVGESQAQQASLLVDLRSSFVSIQITRENLSELLLAKVKQLTQDPLVLERCAKRIEEFA